MAQARPRKILCITCWRPLTPDDTEHYAYHCHACVVDEHELVLAVGRDPDHPERWRLVAGPVDIGRAERPKAQE